MNSGNQIKALPSHPRIARDSRLLCIRVLALLLVAADVRRQLAPHTPFSRTRKSSTWSGPSEIRPLLLKRFPALTDDQIKEAHAYAYGGAVIQDLGYYPFGSTEFSDLVHYVRSGDFVRELLLREPGCRRVRLRAGRARALRVGHRRPSRRSTRPSPSNIPKLRAKYGNSVNYAQDQTAHLKTEFGFDMVQVAKNRYASQQYHDFIGFQVSKPLLERVFPVVYGVELKDVLAHEDLAIGSYRFAVSRMIPEMTQSCAANP